MLLGIKRSARNPHKDRTGPKVAAKLEEPKGDNGKRNPGRPLVRSSKGLTKYDEEVPRPKRTNASKVSAHA